MKALEELGISPTPWKKVNECGYFKVKDSEDYDVACVYGEDDKNIIANGNVLAAVPKLYNSLYDAVIDTCICCTYSEDGGRKCTNEDRDCHIQKWRAALAEARGEVVC